MSNPAIVRKVHKKALPYTVSDIGDKAALTHWKAEQARIEKELETRRNNRIAKAVKVFEDTAAKDGYELRHEALFRQINLLRAVYTPEPELTLLQKVGKFFTSVWKNAKF